MVTAPNQSPCLSRHLLGSGRGTIAAVIGFSLTINLLVLTLPLYMIQIFERVMASHSVSTLTALAVAAFVALAFMAVMESIRSRMLIRIGTWLEETVSPRLFLAGFDAGKSAVHTRNMNRVRAFLTSPGAFAMLDAPWVPLFVGVVFLIHPFLGMATLFAGVIIFGVAWTNDRICRRGLAEAARLSRTASERIDAIGRQAEALAAMGMKAALQGYWRDANRQALAAQQTVNDRIAVMTALSKFIRLGFQVLVVALAVHLVILHEIGMGGMIASSIILSRALSPVEQVLGQWRAWGEARAAWRDIAAASDSFDTPSLIPLSVPKGRLTLENVTYSAPGATTALFERVNIEIEPGTYVAITGRSGAGKTTLARMMAGIQEPDQGHVRLDGASFGAATGYRFGAHVGYLPQKVEFLPGTIADNISRFTSTPDDKVVLAARRAGAHELILSLPNGYETVVGGIRDPLSAGARQRVALARALFGHPRLIILDEPYSNLDGDGVNALMDAVETFRKSSGTVVMVSHRPSITARADRVFEVREGRVDEIRAPVRKAWAG